MKKAELEVREEIVARCREMNASGINQGTSGNISARFGDRMLISPSAIPYDRMTAETIVSMALDDDSGAYDGPLKPSTEWRFHHRLLQSRDDAAAVVHAYPTYCTTLAITRRPIPSCHYMIAAFGGNDVRCADYATFGTGELSALAVEAMQTYLPSMMRRGGSRNNHDDSACLTDGFQRLERVLGITRQDSEESSCGGVDAHTTLLPV